MAELLLALTSEAVTAQL